LKTHVLNLKIVKNLIFNILDIKVMMFQSQIIILDSVQLHLFSVLSLTLTFMNLKVEKFNIENIKSQLN